MSFENTLSQVPAESENTEAEVAKTEQPQQPENTLHHRGLVNRFKRAAALTGAIAAGYFGGHNESQAQNSGSMTEKEEKTYHQVKQEFQAHMPKEGMVQVLASEAGQTWAVEFVPKTKADGKEIYAERFVTLDQATHEIKVVAEYDNVIAARDGLTKMQGVPSNVLKFVEHDAGAVETERAFQNSGLVDPDTVSKSVKDHAGEKADFKGYGLDFQGSR